MQNWKRWTYRDSNHDPLHRSALSRSLYLLSCRYSLLVRTQKWSLAGEPQTLNWRFTRKRMKRYFKLSIPKIECCEHCVGVILMNIKVRTQGAQKQSIYYIETAYFVWANSIAVRHSVTNNRPQFNNNNCFSFQGNIITEIPMRGCASNIFKPIYIKCNTFSNIFTGKGKSINSQRDLDSIRQFNVTKSAWIVPVKLILHLLRGYYKCSH
jgi:hypothetical protein